MDAVIAPLTDPAATDATAHLQLLASTYGPLLGGSGTVYIRAMPGGFFLTANPEDALNLPPSDPSAPFAPRYDWADQGGGVSFGTLRP